MMTTVGLLAGPPRGWRMVEKIKGMRLPEIVGVASSLISAMGMLFGCVLYFSGAFSGATIAAAKLTALEGQVGGLSIQMSRLQDQFNAGPRADQLVAMDRHLSVQDGRMDGMDTRMRDLEQRLSRVQAQQEANEVASRATLNRR